MSHKTGFVTLAILGGLFAGALLGQLMHDPSWHPKQGQAAHAYGVWLEIFQFIGMTVFMGLLKMLIIPLIAVSVIVGISSVGDVRKLGRLGSYTLLYYFATMLIAVTIGLLLVTYMQPGTRIDKAQLSDLQSGDMVEAYVDTSAIEKSAAGGVIGVATNLVSLMIPENVVAAMAKGQTLSVIVFAMFFGVVLTASGTAGARLIPIFESLFEVLMKMVTIVLWIAPLGVGCLLAWTVARIGLAVFGESIGLYMITVLVGLSIHAFIVLPMFLKLFSKARPFQYLYQMRRALLTAFATDSSSATLPVTIDCARSEGGVSERASGLVLPLGSTINMDGTALYEAVAVVFMAQALGIELGLVQLVLIAITATLAAVGAAGIPSAGLVTMVIVVDAVNQSLFSMNPAAVGIPVGAIGLIIGVDRLLDMVRTTVNVWGDAVGAKLISELD